MKSLPKIFTKSFLLTLLIVIGGNLYKTREPTFCGKSLSTWLEYYDIGMCFEVFPQATNDQIFSMQAKADEAVRNMGTKALPILTSMIKARDSRIKLVIAGFLRRHSFKVSLTTAEQSRSRALMAFRALSETAKPAIQELNPLLRRNDTCEAAALALSAIGCGSVNLLIGALTNSNAQIRLAGVEALEDYTIPVYALPVPTPSPQRFQEITACLPDIVSNLFPLLNDSDSRVRARAAEALGFLAKDPNTVIPALVKLLADKDAACRTLTARAIGEFRDEARWTEPNLKLALKDPDPNVRQSLSRTLFVIKHYPSKDN